MSELTKQALRVDNNQSFPNNNAGLITPSALRTFNENMIDSTVNQQVYTADSASFNQRINEATASLATVPWDNVTSKPTNLVSASSDTTNVDFSITNGTISANLRGGVVSGSQQISGLGFVSSSITGSSLVTASFNNNTRNLTFTKGDSSQFSVNIPDVSGSTINTGSFATTGSNTFVGANNFSSSVDILGGLNLYQGGMTLGLPKQMGDPFDTNIAISTPRIIGQSGSGNRLVLSGDTMTNRGVTILNGLGITGSVVISPLPGMTPTGGDLNVAGTFTSSLQQGYVWVGDSSGRTTTVPTSSFGGGGTGNGFPFSGSAVITGSLSVSETIKSQVYMNPQTLSGFTIPTGNNAMLVGPVAVSGSIVVEGTSNLIVLSQVSGSGSGSGTIATGSFATTGSNVFRGNQTITGSLSIDDAGRNAIQISRLSGQTGMVINQTGVGASWFIGTRENNNGNLIISSSANDKYIEFASSSGWIEVYSQQTNFNAGVAFRGQTQVRNIITDGGGYTAQFDSISGSNANISGVMNLTPKNPLPSGRIGDLAVSGSSLYFFNGAWTLVV